MIYVYRALKNSVNPYDMISKKISRDSRLGAAEIGIMLLILSNTDDFNKGLRLSVIKKQSKLKRPSWERAWNNLQECGYVYRKYLGNHKWLFEIHEEGKQAAIYDV